MAGEPAQLLFAALGRPVQAERLLQRFVAMPELLRRFLEIGFQGEADIQENNFDERQQQRQHLFEIVSVSAGEYRKSELNVLVVGPQIPGRFEAHALMRLADAQAAVEITVIENSLQ